MTPIEHYKQLIAKDEFKHNQLQEQAMQQFQHVYTELLAPKKLFKKKNVKGLYLWGSVGIGKTWLMDIFFQNLPLPKKRMHFHQFMQHVHHELKRFQGQSDPLKTIAKHLSKQAKIICLDEFLVHDITDAMILANLLTALFAENITLVTTANVEPDNLYRNGLQRGNFLPAIALIKQHLNTFHLQSATDYRLRDLTATGTYFYPLNAEAEFFMKQHFQHLTHGFTTQSHSLEIAGRQIKVIEAASNVIWFDFKDICHIPRSQNDYLEIAQNYTTVLVSNVPQITEHQDNEARYLINLVDVFYDARVKLIISAAVAIDELYLKGRFSFEFARTRSRLLEMQSRAYIHKEHLS